MEFWGVEVKPGEVLNCHPGDDKYLHISQAALGEIKSKKGNERITLYVHVDDKKVVIGSLVYGKSDQFSLDLVFEKEFKLSHNCRTGSVFLSGYTALTDVGDDAMGGFDDTDSDSEDEQQAQALMSQLKENGQTEARQVKPELKKDGVKSAKPAVTTEKKGAKVKTEVKPVLPSKPGEDEESSDEEEDDEDEDEDMEGSSDEEAESDGDSEDESDEEEDKKTPKTEAAGKKRPSSDSTNKSPGSYKKAKAKTSTPSGGQILGTNEGKKNGPKVPGVTSTPSSKEQKGQTPKAKATPGPKETHKPPTTPGSEKKIGEHPCTPCGKTFRTESALSQHNTAKHGTK